MVKAFRAAKRPGRIYPSIRLPRELWDHAGFGSDDRLLFNWCSKTLTIERTVAGGVKPKSVSEASVVLQSYKLGNLDLTRLKFTGVDGSHRLTDMSEP